MGHNEKTTTKGIFLFSPFVANFFHFSISMSLPLNVFFFSLFSYNKLCDVLHCIPYIRHTLFISFHLIFFSVFVFNFTVFFVVAAVKTSHQFSSNLVNSIKMAHPFLPFRCLFFLLLLFDSKYPTWDSIANELYSAFNDTLTLFIVCVSVSSFCYFLLSVNDIFKLWCKNSKIQCDRNDSLVFRTSSLFLTSVFYRLSYCVLAACEIRETIKIATAINIDAPDIWFCSVRFSSANTAKIHEICVAFCMAIEAKSTKITFSGFKRPLFSIVSPIGNTITHSTQEIKLRFELTPHHFSIRLQWDLFSITFVVYFSMFFSQIFSSFFS